MIRWASLAGTIARTTTQPSLCSGETVGVTGWTADPTDVEALAPAGPGSVWVGDIGDNRGLRDSITVAEVPVQPGDVVREGEPLVRLESS